MSDEQGAGPGLAFVLLGAAELPESGPIVASAAALGIALVPTEADGEGMMLGFAMPDGAPLMVALMPAPHPDVPNMASGPTSPDPDEAAAAPAHLLVTVLALDGDLEARDSVMARVTAAVLAGCSSAIGVMLAHGVMFHRPEMFGQVVEMYDEGELPVETCVDVTVAAEGAGGLSMLTHGLARYGREEFFVTAPLARGDEAYELITVMARWMIADPEKQLPTGDTVGPSADVAHEIKRQQNPTGSEDIVIRLDL